MKKTSLLESILTYAGALFSENKAALTYERYLFAIIETVQNSVPFDVRAADRDGLMEILNERFPEAGGDFGKIKAKLGREVIKHGDGGFADTLTFQSAVMNAEKKAAASGDGELTPQALLLAILDNPSPFIKNSLIDSEPGPDDSKPDENGGKSDEDGEKSGEDGDEDEEDESDSADPAEVIDSFKRFLEGLAASGVTADVEDDDDEEDDGEEPEEDPKAFIENLTQKVRNVRDELGKVVFGQDNAINLFSTGLFQYELNCAADSDDTRPTGTFLFAGPPGVGKTFLVKNVARILGDQPFMRFDMSEFADYQSYMELVGYDRNYKNPKEGTLTSFVKENPKCILLFDEIEKAHLTTIQLFLQILDEGVLSDNYSGERVPFREAMIFFTTNVGKSLYDAPDAFDFSGVSRKVVLKAIAGETKPNSSQPVFPPAICSRFASGNVVMFNHMSATSLCRIVEAEIKKKTDLFEKKYGFVTEIDQKVYSSILFSEGAAADARTLRARAERFFDDEIFELLRFMGSEEHQGDIKALESIRFRLDLPSDPDIRALFCNKEKHKIIVFSSPDVAGRFASECPDVSVVCVSDVDGLKEKMKNLNPVFAAVDLFAGENGERKYINIEDCESSARDAFKYMLERQSDVPIFVLQHSGRKISAEEKASLVRDGARGVIDMDAEGGAAARTAEISNEIYQQQCMTRLASSNKLVKFETGQSISEDGKTADITLFDFSLSTAVDSNDTQNVMSNVSKPNVKFSDIIGAERAKDELRFFIEYLKDPKQFAESGLKAPRGVLLYGPPGTGKTMLAKAVASEAGVTFISAEGNRFLKSHVGEGKDDLHNLFATARRYAPSILFIDEFEAIAQERRGGDQPWAKGEDVLTALLTEMDGFNTDLKRPVFVLAATNFDVEPGSDKSLDQALLRRFDSKICVDLPNKEERIRFINMKKSGSRAFCLSDEKIENIAMRSTGMSLAILDSIMELALRIAIRKDEKKVTDDVLDEAFETYTGGDEKSWNASELERTARHEAGHTFLCWHGGETPAYVTIVARGSHGGYMLHNVDEGKGVYTREELLKMIRTSLGGRAAEIVYYGREDGLTTGASADLVSATRTARHIICTYGMDERFGLAVIDPAAAANGELSRDVRDAVNSILDREMKEAIRIIGENKEKIDALVKELISKNQLSGPEIDRIFKG